MGLVHPSLIASVFTTDFALLVDAVEEGTSAAVTPVDRMTLFPLERTRSDCLKVA